MKLVVNLSPVPSLLCVSLIMASCTQYSNQYSNRDRPGDAHYQFQKIYINEVVVIPPGQARLFFQDGNIVTAFDHYKPNCNIEVKRLDDKNGQQIKPSWFTVTAVQQTLEEVVNLEFDQKVHMARMGGVENGTWFSLWDDGPSDIYRGYHFYLSGEDKNVYRLSCRGAYAAPHEAELPSYNEIKHALGDIISLHPVML